MSKPKILRCRICGRSDYLPIAVPVRDKTMPGGVDFVFSGHFRCPCGKTVDITDRESVEQYIDLA